jgi:RNA polymerase sigma-70 factor (ECF subfamily)
MPSLRLKLRPTTAESSPGLAGLSDRELVRLAFEGNAGAFEVIYERHSTTAFSLACRICGQRDVAEDVVQEAFLSVWRNLERYDPRRGELRSWLLGIVHNSGVDRLRRSGPHERRRASAEGIEELLEAPERTEETVEQREEAAAVREALGALPEEQRRVIELAYFAGLTQNEIAAKLAQPVGTVKGRMRLGLLKMHAQLVRAWEQVGNRSEARP